MKITNKVIVLGCGNGGMALAADLKLKGAQVALWADPAHANKLNEIIQHKGNIFFTDNEQQHIAKLDLVSSDLTEVTEFGDILYNCTPMPAHTPLFNKLIDTLTTTQPLKLFINLSVIFSSVEQLLNTRSKDIHTTIKIFDTSSFPYACRAGKSNDVYILGRKTEIAIASLFPGDNQYLDLLPESCLPTYFSRVNTIFQLGLMGTNPILHPATVLLNARLIDQGHLFQFYQEGLSKRTSRLHEALDNERLSLAKALGYTLTPCAEDYSKFYKGNFDTIYDIYKNSIAHSKISAPTTLHHRFVTEDIAYGFVPLLTLAKIYNVHLPHIESLVNIFSTIMNNDFYQHGRNLKGITKQLIDELSS